MSDEQRYYDALRRIAKEFAPIGKLIEQAERLYGVTASEAVEMAYENIQEEAKDAIRGKRRPKE